MKKNKLNNYKSKLLSACFLGAFMSAAPLTTANGHDPLVNKTAPSVSIEYIMGENEISDLSAAIEERVMDKALRKRLEDKVSDSAIDAARIAYAQSVFKPLWTYEAAMELYDIAELFESHGLDADLTTDRLDKLINARFQKGDPDIKAAAELGLTALWLRLTADISGGLSDQGEAVKSRTNAPVRSELTTSIRRAAQGNPIGEMEDFAPKAPQYRNLRKALEHYKKEARLNSWKAIPKGRGLIELGDEDKRVPSLEQRLRDEGFLPPPTYASLTFPTLNETSTVYSEALENAVKAFQTKHGMKVDGIVGPATIRAMNESPESKIKKIEDALDYWRNLDAFNQQSGDRYIWVNVPSFRAEGWNNGQMEIAMDTIVGKKRTPTAAFSDEIEYIVTNPKWFLPIGLFKRQKLRKLRNDPGYAAQNHYKIYDRQTREELDPYAIDWTEKGVSRKIQMVQQPGAHNALGELKIIFPNRHSIYLHSTPSKHLFERDMRALSSGCVRLDDPVAMANWITDHDEAIDTEDFNRTLHSNERDRFHLARHLPVHITYIGVTADEYGNATFHRDIYNKLDKPLMVKEEYNFEPVIANVSLKSDGGQDSYSTVQKPSSTLRKMP